ncbi:MAG: ankyrin repeat domain-containing protein [Candidatus Polarisedimenticolia bacterium]
MENEETPARPEEAIFDAVRVGDADRLRRILETHPEWANARNAEGDTVLLSAAYAGRRDLFELLIAKGAGVNLHEACALGLKDRVAAALQEEPQAVGAYSHDGWTPLHLAAFFGHKEVAALLLERGAEVNAVSKSTRFARANTPLHAAAANRQVEVATLLLERGADVNARDGHGFTPLALAANGRNDLLVILLLERGAQAV